MTIIPFNRPSAVGREAEYMREAASSGHLAGGGAFTQRCEAFLQQQAGVERVFLTSSCTHALEMSALLLDIREGDEVILPSFTFVSTVNAFVLRGARPVFVDIRPDTLNLDETLLPHVLRPSTKAVVVVHYAGVGCEMDAILRATSAMGVPVVEDNAHGLFGRYRGRPLGSFGVTAALSFHDTKNVTCGEGGALLLKGSEFVSRAEILREKGTDRSRFFRGEVDKYTWVDVGSSYLPSELQAAFLLAQLECSAETQAKRAGLFARYQEALEPWASANGVRLPCVPPHCDQAYHMFHLRLPSLGARDRFLEHLKARSIQGVFHYQPLHRAPMAARWGNTPGAYPVTEAASDQLARLPFYTTLSRADQDRVIDAALSFVP